ncbi:Folylpolyglutamate synthase [Paratrimastix pyriformis]|uniref:tetrahydrofolate synthase n=1 Tax=Paratrimastix pyriformis TaxID=342808 RepID=A0ABQ8UTY6_9EUKA|nr:Folylpolyglutamate synthase [Paratrimastix pyriformis]
MACARTYEGALQQLGSLTSNQQALALSKVHSRENTLEHMQSCLTRLGLDLSNLPVIHVAGTKGKGSTCSFCEAILRSHGLKTGLYTSPHLVDIRERFKINNKMISKDTFASLFWDQWDRLRTSGPHEEMPSYFKFLTLMAFKLFVDQRVDAAIVEVGIGGRIDATNVVHPHAAGVARLDLDHVAVLGNTLPLIAGEKAGIMKPDVPSATVAQKSEALAVLAKRAHEVGSPLYIIPSLKNVFADPPRLGLAAAARPSPPATTAAHHLPPITARHHRPPHHHRHPTVTTVTPPPPPSPHRHPTATPPPATTRHPPPPRHHPPPPATTPPPPATTPPPPRHPAPFHASLFASSRTSCMQLFMAKRAAPGARPSDLLPAERIEWDPATQRPQSVASHLPLYTPLGLLRTALEETTFAGRCQTIRLDRYPPCGAGPEGTTGAERPAMTLFLDGAHTPESIAAGLRWFLSAARGGPNRRRVLLFNSLQTRDPAPLLLPLRDAVADPPFSQLFLAAPAGDSTPDWQDHLRALWSGTPAPEGRPIPPATTSATVEEALTEICSLERRWKAEAIQAGNGTLPADFGVDVLVIGSLHLVGEALKALQVKEV